MAIRNIVFDVGNVLVPWDPRGIEIAAFGEDRVLAPGYVSPLRQNDLWIAINRGEYSLEEARPLFIERYGFCAKDVDRLYEALFESFPLIAESEALLRELSASGYGIYAITDNVHEIVAMLKERHDFWPLFRKVAVSAELGVMKPDPTIYRWLLEKADIVPEESVFLDDVERNVEGARALGMKALVFTDAAQARRDLGELGVAAGPAG